MYSRRLLLESRRRERGGSPRQKQRERERERERELIRSSRGESVRDGHSFLNGEIESLGAVIFARLTFDVSSARAGVPGRGGNDLGPFAYPSS